MPPLPWECPQCRTPNRLHQPYCDRCGLPRPARPVAPRPRGKDTFGVKIALFIGGAFLFLTLALAVMEARQPRPAAPRDYFVPGYAAHRQEINLWMRDTDVRRICGEPLRIQRTDAVGDTPTEYWYYDGGNSQLVFRYGRLSSINTY